MTHTHTLADCQKILTELNDYVDGELAPSLCRELETHLTGCQNCQVVLDTLTKTVYLVHQLGNTPDQLPSGVESRLFAVLQLEDFLPDLRG